MRSTPETVTKPLGVWNCSGCSLILVTMVIYLLFKIRFKSIWQYFYRQKQTFKFYNSSLLTNVLLLNGCSDCRFIWLYHIMEFTFYLTLDSRLHINSTLLDFYGSFMQRLQLLIFCRKIIPHSKFPICNAKSKPTSTSYRRPCI